MAVDVSTAGPSPDDLVAHHPAPVAELAGDQHAELVATDDPTTDDSASDDAASDDAATPAARPRRRFAAARRRWRRVAGPLGLAGHALLGGGLVLMAVLLGPLVVGGQAAVVASGSMTPTLMTGDVVLMLPTTAARARVGDIVVFADPQGSGKSISHRLVDRRIEGGRAAMTTRGDANPSSENWTVPSDDELGRVVLRVPLMGFAVDLLRTPQIALPVALAPAVVLLLVELGGIWRPARRDDAPVP